MFSTCPNLEDSSAINDWDINIDASFDYMFAGVANRPVFSKVAGTWSNIGTFTPTP